VDITTPQGSIGARVRHPVLSSELRAGNAVWRVSIGRSSADRPISGFVILLAGAMLAGLVLVMMRRRQRERDRAAHEIDVRTRQLQLIATTSATLQQSLDLAELLPLFTVDIADEFDLACVAVHITDEQGAFLEIFRHGRVPSSDPGLVVDLRRGWRTVGRLLVHPRRPLDDVSVQSLQAAADLLAIAVTNSQLYEREQQAVSRLNELDALKNAFLSTVSHELRTATTAVQGFADLLTEHWDVTPDDRRREMASRIHRQSGSLRHLVDDLLDYARLDAERLRVTPRDVVLTEIVEHLAETFSSLVATHRLVVDAEPGLHAWVDPIAVERILANLLSNAGKYAPADTTVTVTLVRHGDRARLSVADQGPGIPEAERRRVFVRFYRLDNAQTIRTHGAGIGLAILQDFADRSGADVTIEDAPGGGALVHVDFPTAPTTARPGESA
jgi:signal transduction histidine kinase